MDYKKPTTVELNSRAQAAGREPSCINGPTAGAMFCTLGSAGDPSTQPCNVGPNPGMGAGGDICVNGNAPTFGYCNQGISGQLYGDDCTSGPFYTKT
jgi:hypothetical protein